MARIEISDVCVDFPVYGLRARSLKSKLFANATGGRFLSSDEEIVIVRALDGVSLSLKAGDRVGLIGHNGSGKTTLLRSLANIYQPKSGLIDIDGRVTAMLSLNAGMEADATGLENIYLRGYVLGKSKSEITDKFEEIVEFSELSEFIHLPLRTYSSGMSARLAFSIWTAWQTEILLLDEVIGTIDAGFREKADERINQVFNHASIIVLASHSENLISKFCNRVVSLERGRIISDVVTA